MAQVMQLQPKKKKRARARIAILVLAIGSILGTMYFAPIFNVSTVYCVGNKKIPSEEIEYRSGVVYGKNIFLTGITQIKSRVAQIPYVNKTNAKREFPNTIKIWVEECVPAAVVAFRPDDSEQQADKLYVLDKNGKVLEELKDEEPEAAVTEESEIQDAATPVVAGLDITKIEVGKIIGVVSEIRLEAVLECMKRIEHNNLTNITKVDVGDMGNITMSVDDRIDVALGSAADLSYRINFLASIIKDKKISQTEKGFLDLTVEKPYFKPKN